MKVKNDEYDTREFTVNANSVRQIDFVTGPCGVPGGQNVMVLADTVSKGSVLQKNKYRFTFSVSARNTPPVQAVFEAMIRDNNLTCVRLRCVTLLHGEEL
jgi:hypothetical protein